MENKTELASELLIRKYLHELDREATLPLWIQVRNMLHRAILDPDMEVSSRLPSEQNLCQIFGASRPIIRMALENLVSSGLINKLPRQGIFVSPRPTDIDFVSLNKGMFSEKARIRSITTRVLSVTREPPTKKEKEVFSLPSNSDVVRIVRVYYVEKLATAVTTLSLAGHKVPGIENKVSDNVSVYGLLKDNYGLIIHNSERWFEAIMPDPEEAKWLGIDHSQPVIKIESIGRTSDGQVLEYFNSVYNTLGGRIRITVKAD